MCRSSIQVSSVSHKAHVHPQMELVSMGGAPGIGPLWIDRNNWNWQLSKPTYLDPSSSASVSRNFSLECPHKSHYIFSRRLLEHSASRFLPEIQVNCLLQTWDVIPHDQSQGVSMSVLPYSKARGNSFLCGLLEAPLSLGSWLILPPSKSTTSHLPNPLSQSDCHRTTVKNTSFLWSHTNISTHHQ